MSIEIGSKWVKDVEVVEVKELDSTFPDHNPRLGYTIVWFMHSTKTDYMHVLTERDFLEQYKPYEPVYEYRYVTDIYCETKILNRYFTEDEIKEEYEVYQRIDFTKRERK